MKIRYFLCPKCDKNLDEHEKFCGAIYNQPEQHPVMEFIESIHPAVRVLFMALMALGAGYLVGWIGKVMV